MKRKTAVIHTTPVTIPVISKLAEKYCGDMEIVNLLDDSMLPEINRAGIITEGVKYRLNTLLAPALPGKRGGIRPHRRRAAPQPWREE